MKLRNAIGTVALMLLTAAPAEAFNWSLGANLGYTARRFDANQDEVNEFVIPFSGMAPGLRVGFAESENREIFFDTSASFYRSTLDGGSSNFSDRLVLLVGNYQHNVGGTRPWAPYLVAGAGITWIWTKAETVDPLFGPVEFTIEDHSLVYGGGLGISHNMGNRHGRLRLEARYDRVHDLEQNLFSLKLGFDMWDGQR